MKTYRHLYPQITDFANLYAAFRKARRGKRDRPEVAEFEFNLEANLFQLQEELVTHTYQPGAYRNFYIREVTIQARSDLQPTRQQMQKTAD